MGQKVNPNIFRLGVNKKWKTEFFEKKNQELPNYTFKDLEIKEFIERLLETRNLLLHDYKLHYSDSLLNINISYFVTSSFIFDKTFNQHENISLIKKKGNQKIIIKSIKSNSKRNIQQLMNSSKESIKKSDLSLPNSSKKIKKYLKVKSYKSPVLSSNKFKISNLSLVAQNQKNKSLNLSTNYSKLIPLKNLEHLQGQSDLNKWLKGLSLFTKERYNISTTFQCINKSFNLTLKQIQSLKEKFMLLQKFKNIPFFTESIDVLFMSISHTKSANLLAKLISFQLRKIKRHNFFLAFLKKTLTLFVDSNFSKVKGIKIIVKGRLNGVPRARHKILIIGNVPVQTIMANIDFSQTACHNANGSYGIKVWVIEKD